jgi:hypothetical protein
MYSELSRPSPCQPRVLLLLLLTYGLCAVRLQVLGTPTLDEIQSMNQNYTEYKFPQVKPHPWPKVFRPRTSQDAIDLASQFLRYAPQTRMKPLEGCTLPFFDELRQEGLRLPNTGAPPPPLFDFKPQGESPRLLGDVGMGEARGVSLLSALVRRAFRAPAGHQTEAYPEVVQRKGLIYFPTLRVVGAALRRRDVLPRSILVAVVACNPTSQRRGAYLCQRSWKWSSCRSGLPHPALKSGNAQLLMAAVLLFGAQRSPRSGEGLLWLGGCVAGCVCYSHGHDGIFLASMPQF